VQGCTDKNPLGRGRNKLAITWFFATVLVGLFSDPFLTDAFARNGQFSFMASYSKSNYGNNSYSTQRRYTFAGAMNLTPVTEIELSFTSSKAFINYDPYQTTTTNDAILGLSLIQVIVPPTWPIQPYVKVGAAQYNRKQTGTINGVPTAPTSTKSPSAIFGGGIRAFFARSFSLKLEITTYLPDMEVDQAKNNYAAQAGLGWHF